MPLPVLLPGSVTKIEATDPRNAREFYLTKPEVARIVSHMREPKGKAAVWLLSYCGPRIEELRNHPKSVGSRLHFPKRTTKNSKARIVPVPKAAQQHLAHARRRGIDRRIMQHFREQNHDGGRDRTTVSEG